MSSLISDALTAEFSRSEAARDVAARLNGRWSELTYERLAESLLPEEAVRLPLVIRRLTSVGVVQPWIRVLSRATGVGLRDVLDPLDVPEEIDDYLGGTQFKVLPSDLRIVIKRAAGGS